jgi:hypothetical protein
MTMWFACGKKVCLMHGFVKEGRKKRKGKELDERAFMSRTYAPPTSIYDPPI